MREMLPQRRESETFEMRWGGQNTLFFITLSRYEDGRIGEVFISGAKTGSDTESVTRDGAVLISLALQHGVSLETIKHAITRNLNGDPSSIVGAVVDRIAG